MVDAAMRDSTRRLNEQTLPGIGLSASGTGNANNTRRFMNEAIAQARYDDRRADIRSDIGRDLVNQYLRSDQTDFNNQMRANQGLRDVFGVGTTLAPAGADALTRGGGMLQMDEQGQLDANRAAFERERDFAMGQYGSFGNILGGMPSVGQISPSRANPYTAALSGGMMGAGFGRNIMDYFNQNRQLVLKHRVHGSICNLQPDAGSNRQLLLLLGILSDTTLPLPILLDTIAHSETGHLTGNARATATQSKRG